LKEKILPPIKETAEDYDDIEKVILDFFKSQLFVPLMKIVYKPTTALQNTKYDLRQAIRAGRISFHRGVFSGKLSATTSKELRSLGAKFDRKTGTYHIHKSKLPDDITKEIQASADAFQKTLSKIDDKINDFLPKEFTGKISVRKAFDKALWKTDDKIDKTLKKIAVLPQLTDDRAKRISEEWTNNLELTIKKFQDEEIPKLRQKVMAHALKGGRYEDLAKIFEREYQVTANKARFWARQETSLLMAKYKETRYQEAGVDEYIWGCVVGSPNHPVRPSHKALEGKRFRFSDPPITTAPSEPARRNNPGHDYNCRCFAKPIVKFK